MDISWCHEFYLTTNYTENKPRITRSFAISSLGVFKSCFARVFQCKANAEKSFSMLNRSLKV